MHLVVWSLSVAATLSVTFFISWCSVQLRRSRGGARLLRALESHLVGNRLDNFCCYQCQEMFIMKNAMGKGDNRSQVINQMTDESDDECDWWRMWLMTDETERYDLASSINDSDGGWEWWRIRVMTDGSDGGWEWWRNRVMTDGSDWCRLTTDDN